MISLYKFLFSNVKRNVFVAVNLNISFAIKGKRVFAQFVENVSLYLPAETRAYRVPQYQEILAIYMYLPVTFSSYLLSQSDYFLQSKIQ